MHIAKVIGNAVGSKRSTALNGKKLLIIQPLDDRKQPDGEPVVAVDAIGAGIGEHVFFVRGGDTASPFFQGEKPADAGIVGIIDYFNVQNGPEKS